MKSSRRLVVAGLAMLGLAHSAGALRAEEAGAEGEIEPTVAADDPCPWVPRSGRWKMQAGQMSFFGVWTPMGGGAATMHVRVENCGESIVVTGPPEIGTVVFRPTDRKPAIVKGPEGWVYWIHGNAEQELTRDEQVILDYGIKGIGLKTEHERDLQEPPAELEFFEFNLYRGVLSTGTVAWYLDYVTQFDMYSVTLLEGVAAPPHQQFHRWTYLGD